MLEEMVRNLSKLKTKKMTKNFLMFPSHDLSTSLADPGTFLDKLRLSVCDIDDIYNGFIAILWPRKIKWINRKRCSVFSFPSILVNFQKVT